MQLYLEAGTCTYTFVFSKREGKSKVVECLSQSVHIHVSHNHYIIIIIYTVYVNVHTVHAHTCIYKLYIIIYTQYM